MKHPHEATPLDPPTRTDSFGYQHEDAPMGETSLQSARLGRVVVVGLVYAMPGTIAGALASLLVPSAGLTLGVVGALAGGLAGVLLEATD